MSWPGGSFIPPPSRARRWVEKSVGPGSEVIRVHRLKGGTASAMHAVDVRAASGSVVRLALRRYLASRLIDEMPDAAAREARNLQVVEEAAISAPRLVAVDVDGDECDVPAVLMTHLAGHLELRPRDLDLWLRRMAELLPAIHAVHPPAGVVSEWEMWDDLREAQPPVWSRNQSDWRQLIEIVQRPWPSYTPRFVHRDFQHYNVLWSRGRPTGVVDWLNASMGPVELDFSHFRHNLVFHFGYEAAERFARIYEVVTGERADPFWEALTLPVTWADSTARREASDAYASSLVMKLC